MTGVSREQLIADLRAIDTAPDKPPMVSHIQSECEGTVRAYLSEFGTWYGALDAAGLATDVSPPEANKEALIEDLQRVRSELDRSPTGDHIAELGAYAIDTYELVFGSYLLALEAAGIDPETTQYNFSEVEPPDHRGATKNVRHLREHGPTPSSEMPLGSSVSDRKHGMWRFVMNSGQGSTDNGGGATEAVYYLDEQHDAKAVLRAFFETNDALVRNKSRHGIVLGVRNHNPEWVDIAKGLLDEIAEASHTESETEVGVVVVTPTEDALAQAVERTAKTPAENVDVIEGVNADSGYVIGMAEEQHSLWKRINTGDIVVVQTDAGSNTFTVEQTVRDWNATADLWAQYEDGVRVTGPDRPWPYLLVGTTGGEVDLSIESFWSAVSVDETADQIQYVPETALAELRSEYDTFWQFVSAQSDSDSDSIEQEEIDETDAEISLNTHRSAVSDGGPESTTVEIDATIAFLVSEQQADDVASFVGAHLKHAVDGLEPAVSAVTSQSTAAVPVELTDTQHTLISALCGDDGAYESIDAFVEDAIRTRMDISDTDQELKLRLTGETAAALDQLAEREGTEVNNLLSEHITELLSEEIY